MICQRCGDPQATVHFTEVIGATKRERRLCAACAKSEGLFVNLDLGSASAALEDALGPQRSAEAPMVPVLRCPSCECDLAQLRKSGRVGCPECYDVFAEALAPFLEQAHGCREHVRPDSAEREERP